MTKRKIYVASSWRNVAQNDVVTALRKANHEVYDFKNPPTKTGFRWKDASPLYETAGPEWYMADIERNEVARQGYKSNIDALNWCDTCVLVLPCGRSAHLEAGYACGQGKDVIFMLSKDQWEPELMYLMGTGFVMDMRNLLVALSRNERKTLTTYGVH